jgi:hypothetical protein
MYRATLCWMFLFCLTVASCSRPDSNAADKAADGGPAAGGAEPPAAVETEETGWIALFDGKSLDGWTPNENPDSWTVKDGVLIARGERSHLFYTGPVENHRFKNFEWKCEIMTRPGANSGMYFHTDEQEEGWPGKGVEIQVNNTDEDPIKTGSIYKVKDIKNQSPVKDNEWFTQHVIVKDNKIVVKVNGKVVNEFDWPDDLERDEGWEDNVMSSGTFCLQAHDPESEVHYRQVLVKPLP